MHRFHVGYSACWSFVASSSQRASKLLAELLNVLSVSWLTGETNLKRQAAPCWLAGGFAPDTSEQSSHWLTEGIGCDWLIKREGREILHTRSKSQSTAWGVSWWDGGAVRKAFAKNNKKPGVGWWMVSRRSGHFTCCPVYPAISVAVVTSLLPSQTVLNCSGTGNSGWQRGRGGVREQISHAGATKRRSPATSPGGRRQAHDLMSVRTVS